MCVCTAQISQIAALHSAHHHSPFTLTKDSGPKFPLDGRGGLAGSCLLWIELVDCGPFSGAGGLCAPASFGLVIMIMIKNDQSTVDKAIDVQLERHGLCICPDSSRDPPTALRLVVPVRPCDSAVPVVVPLPGASKPPPPPAPRKSQRG